MTSEPLVDHGQTLSAPVGKVIGFLDAKAKCEAFADALSAAGDPERTITTLFGEDGIHILERLKEHSFFFGDSEDNMIERSMRELRQGHYVVAIEVKDHQEALDVAGLAKRHGGHGFTHFGTWVTEQLPT